MNIPLTTIQGLNQKVDEQRAELKAWGNGGPGAEKHNSSLEARLEKLERLPSTRVQLEERE